MKKNLIAEYYKFIALFLIPIYLLSCAQRRIDQNIQNTFFTYTDIAKDIKKSFLNYEKSSIREDWNNPILLASQTISEFSDDDLSRILKNEKIFKFAKNLALNQKKSNESLKLTEDYCEKNKENCWKKSAATFAIFSGGLMFIILGYTSYLYYTKIPIDERNEKADYKLKMTEKMLSEFSVDFTSKEENYLLEVTRPLSEKQKKIIDSFLQLIKDLEKRDKDFISEGKFKIDLASSDKELLKILHIEPGSEVKESMRKALISIYENNKKELSEIDLVKTQEYILNRSITKNENRVLKINRFVNTSGAIIGLGFFIFGAQYLSSTLNSERKSSSKNLQLAQVYNSPETLLIDKLAEAEKKLLILKRSSGQSITTDGN